MQLECNVVEKISKKNEPYYCLRVELGANVKKDFFLNDSDVALLSLLNSKNSN